MQFLGFFKGGQVVNAQEDVAGEYDMGKGYIKNSQGSVIAELSKGGLVMGNRGQTVGRIEGFSFEKMPILAAFIILVDMDYVKGF